MVWVFRAITQGFEDLSLAEMLSFKLTQVSNRYFYGETFDINRSAYGLFSVKEVSRGSSPEEVIQNFTEEVESPYRVEKFANKRRRGSQSYALLAEKYIGGEIRAFDPKTIILVFTPDEKTWIAGFVTEKKDSIVDKLNSLQERTCVSLTSNAALALVNISDGTPIVDPCCGTGLIPLAALLAGKSCFAADKSFNMLRMARNNRDFLGLELDISPKDAFEPWIKDCCLVTDFPADRSWMTNTEELSLKLFLAWVPFIKSFCVIFPNYILNKLPNNIFIKNKIKFTADRTIIIGNTI